MKRVLIVAFVALSCVPGIAYADSDGSQSLGSFSGGRAYPKPIFTSLHRKPLGGEYVLEVTAKAIEPGKQCELSITSRIIEIDAAGKELSQRVIFQGRGFRECGDRQPDDRWPDGPMARSPDRQRFSLKYLICHS
jgi:hypothetical protein